MCFIHPTTRGARHRVARHRKGQHKHAFTVCPDWAQSLVLVCPRRAAGSSCCSACRSSTRRRRRCATASRPSGTPTSCTPTRARGRAAPGLARDAPPQACASGLLLRVSLPATLDVRLGYHPVESGLLSKVSPPRPTEGAISYAHD